jgi:hypothetical protein
MTTPRITSMFLHDAYTDRPKGARAELEHEIERLRVMSWADPADRELRQEVERLQAELARLNGGNVR